MSTKEGSLEAPTRKPIAWNQPDFWDTAKLERELERVFDICHGCRRCVSLCGAFPTLFDLVDNSPSGELDTVPKERYAAVVDQCYLCDICFMTKCPYVPPHVWDLDFPHLMLRAKAVEFRRTGGRWRDRVLSSTDRLGTFAGIPIVTQTVNAVNQSRPGRAIAEKLLGVDRRAWRPDYAGTRFLQSAKDNAVAPVRDGARTPGKVAVYATCFVNYNEPGIGHDLLKILAHNDIAYVVVEKEACCGMPKLELGDLDGVRRLKEINIPALAHLAREGYAILAAIPSCTLMFSKELPLLFPQDPEVRLVSEAMWDPFDYFVARNKDGLLKVDFPRPLGAISYHVPCHSRVQNLGRKTEEVLKWLPQTSLTTVERCSGHAGTWGVKKEFHSTAMKIGAPVFRSMAQAQPDFISSDCQLAGHHIEQGIEQLEAAPASGKKPRLAHPLTLLRMAYGID
ncbi:MAG TPA: heterodisulfide reductase-related iron-sulfur binding cluster, partial [Burkholderiaceae bacterium]|nr:heterodisulfide reductase-related iron-sulfur binding cluster [Burkholderiaceae bacterium]